MKDLAATQPVPAADAVVALATGIDLSRRLRRLLHDEFEALRQSDLNAFEKLQANKEALIATLRDIHRMFPAQTSVAAGDPSRHSGWDDMFATLRECRDLQRRNELLINARMDAIRGALSALQGSDPVAEAGTYDRKGRSRRPRRDLGWDEA